jgi:hypothetical protein
MGPPNNFLPSQDSGRRLQIQRTWTKVHEVSTAVREATGHLRFLRAQPAGCRGQAFTDSHNNFLDPMHRQACCSRPARNCFQDSKTGLSRFQAWNTALSTLTAQRSHSRASRAGKRILSPHSPNSAICTQLLSCVCLWVATLFELRP